MIPRRSHTEIMRTINYDELKVPDYILPEVVTHGMTAAEWMNGRRQEILDFYQREVYGAIPPRPDTMRTELLSRRDDALDGTAIRKELRIHFSMSDGRSHYMDMLLYIPKQASCPAPVFLGLCFRGYQITTPEKDVRTSAMRHPAGAEWSKQYGMFTERWQFREAIRRGFAAATISYHDIFPDYADGWSQSIYTLFCPPEELRTAGSRENGSLNRAHRRYSAIGAWAWGLSRALDALENEPLVDASRTALHGHSRLGKAALWAGACDQRFKLVIANDSGCGGAALFKRRFGETAEAILNAAPHWFVSGFSRYSAAEDTMPFDQHFLLSLIAPRPLAIASATEDLWADPLGEFLAAKHAGAVYRLFGSIGLPAAEQPSPDVEISGDISYHLRTGKHDQTAADWHHYFCLAERFLLSNASFRILSTIHDRRK